MKTIYRKSWPANLLQASNLTFDPCFKVNFCLYTKRPYMSLIIGPRASKYETTFCENHGL